MKILLNFKLNLFLFFSLFILGLYTDAHSQSNFLEITENTTCFDATFMHYDFSKKDLSNFDKKKVIKLCLEEIKKKGRTVSLISSLGKAYFNDKQYLKAKDKFLEAFEMGDHYSPLYLHEIYFFGHGVDFDLEKSIFYLQESIRIKELPWSVYSMSLCYLNGWGVEQNKDLAYQFMKKSADMGNSRAKVRISREFLTDEDSNFFNLGLAREYLTEEANKGFPEASFQKALIQIYFPYDDSDFTLGVKSVEKIAFLENKKFNVEARRFYIRMNLLSATISEIKSVYENFEPNYEKGIETFISMISSKKPYEVSLALNLIEDQNISANINDKDGIRIIEVLKKELNEQIQGNSDKKTIIFLSKALAYIYGEGSFGPIDLDNQEKYMLIAIKNGSFTDAIDLGYEMWSKDSNEKALKYTELALDSPNLITKYYAHTILGTLMEEKKLFSSAETEWLKAINLEIEDKSSTPYENLVRLYLFGSNNFKNDLKKAKKFSNHLDQIFEISHYKNIIKNYNLDEKFTQNQILKLFVNEADMGNTKVIYDIADAYNKVDEINNAIKWFKICNILCDDYESSISEINLEKLKKKIRGSLYNEIISDSRKWIKNKSLNQNDNKNEAISIKETLYEDYNFYALLIGVQDYDYIQNLNTPKNDILEISNILQSKFGFKTEELINPTRRKITQRMNYYTKTLNENDSFLIYFAGHGKEVDGHGYWLSKEALLDDDSDWISNDYITRKLKSMKSNNIIVLADACFSGTLARGLDVENKKSSDNDLIDLYMNTKSRIVISSGNIEPVLDGGGGKNSVFARALIETLLSEKKYLTSTNLAAKLVDIVTKETIDLGLVQTPIHASLNKAGHYGPDFVFIEQK